MFWVETKGRTLEEIDAIFEGEKHSSVPDVEAVRQGKETITAAGEGVVPMGEYDEKNEKNLGMGGQSVREI